MTDSLPRRLLWSAWLLSQTRAAVRFPYRTLEQIKAEQDRQVRRIVAHAYATVPFYRRVMDERGLRPADFSGASDLSKLPLVTKGDVQGNLEQFSSRRWLYQELPHWRTGGTTGQSLTIRFNMAFMMRVLLLNRRDAAVWRPLIDGPVRQMTLTSRYSIVPFLLDFYRQRTWVPQRRRPALATVFIDQPLEEQIAQINRFRPSLLNGYASAVERLWRYQRDTGVPVHCPRVILTISEGLSSAVRHQIEATWETSIFSRYGVVETVKVGFECEAKQGFHVHSDWCAVRLVDGTGADVGPAERGEVVISGLVNEAVVLLNYRLGDQAVWGQGLCPCSRNLPRLESFEGRTAVSMKLPNGRYIVIGQLTVPITHRPEILLFQVVYQEVDRFVVYLVPAEGADVAAEQAAVRSIFEEVCGPGIRVEVRIASEIPLTRGGKRPRYVSLVE